MVDMFQSSIFETSRPTDGHLCELLLGHLVPSLVLEIILESFTPGFHGEPGQERPEEDSVSAVACRQGLAAASMRKGI